MTPQERKNLIEQLVPKPDYQVSSDFLDLVHGDSPLHLVSISEGSGPIAKSFKSNERQQARTWLEMVNRKGGNCYFSVNPLKSGILNRKAKKEHIASVTAFHVDVDDPSKQALQKLVDFHPKPSAVIFSGGGYQAFWKLDGQFDDLERAETINKWLADQLGGDACQNVDRIMRVPGTINWPNKKKRAQGRVPVAAYVLEKFTDANRIHRVEDFSALVGENSSLNFPILANSHVASEIPEEPVPPIKLDDLDAEVSTELRHLIEQGDDNENPRTTTKPKYPSRSEAVFAAGKQLSKLGVETAEIAGILANPDYRISDHVRERKPYWPYAWRQACRAHEAASTRFSDVSKEGRPLKTVQNTIDAITMLGIQCRMDLFRNRLMIQGQAIQHYAGEVSDKSAAMLRKIFLNIFQWDAGRQHIIDAITMKALENSFHPVRDYFDGLEWDGINRLKYLMHEYFGADDNELNSVAGALILVAACRRVQQPGAKFDIVVVLEGIQGSGKSTALNIIAGNEFFSDQSLLSLDDKGIMEVLEGVLIFEISELDGMARTEISRIKSVVTRTHDRARRAYGYFRETWPRQTIFVGTTNESFYLKDTTGNRRFLPVKTAEIDLERLKADRDQLWAEASFLESQGMSIGLPKHLWETAAVAQEERLQTDPWLDILVEVHGTVKNGIERISTISLFDERHLNIHPSQQQQYHPKRLAECMRKLGWAGPKKLRIEGNVVRGYERPSDKIDTPEI